MPKQLKFVKLRTSLKGLMVRALREFDRYLDEEPNSYLWVCVEDPEIIARSLEVLSEDLPEEDIAQVVTRLPYLMLLFHKMGEPIHIPVEPMLAMLSILNRHELVTLLRQTADRSRLAQIMDLNPKEWVPVFFLMAGVPDLDIVLEPLEQSNLKVLSAPSEA